MFSNNFYENRDLYETMLKNTAELGRLQMTIWRMRISFWIPKATNTHKSCVMLIAFPLEERLHERASVLRGICFACRNVLQTSVVTGCKASKRITVGIFLFTTCTWKMHSACVIYGYFVSFLRKKDILYIRNIRTPKFTSNFSPVPSYKSVVVIFTPPFTPRTSTTQMITTW